MTPLTSKGISCGFKCKSFVLCIAEQELRLSIDTWTELLTDFVGSVIQRPVYVAGNSLGKCSPLQRIVASQHVLVCQHRTRGIVSVQVDILRAIWLQGTVIYACKLWRTP